MFFEERRGCSDSARQCHLGIRRSARPDLSVAEPPVGIYAVASCQRAALTVVPGVGRVI